MALTNAMIIFNESMRLMDEGVLKGSGKYIEVEKEDGTTEKIELPEPIHTYKHWQELGYQVKRGETSFIKFDTWYFKKGKKFVEAESGEEREGRGKCYMRLTSFFTMAQVKKNDDDKKTA